MNDYLVMVGMLSLFSAFVYGAYLAVRALRARGYGDRLDALHAMTVKAQFAVLRVMGTVLRRPPTGLPFNPLPPRAERRSKETPK